MDASHSVSAQHELSTAPVAFGVEGPTAPGAVYNSAVGVREGVDPHGPTASKCQRWKIRRSSQANRRVRSEC